jgi:hypothetical protein
MMEAGAVIGSDGEVIFWHSPDGRHGGALPDSRELWDVLWENRASIRGFAHSHPGSGVPGPSYTDVTTFAAVEAALGRRLTWWITSSDCTSVVQWCGPDKLSYGGVQVIPEPEWVERLRELSEIRPQQQ